MTDPVNYKKVQFEIPMMRPHPGYWICSILFLISSTRIIGKSGLIQGLPLIILAALLPFISYWSRSSYPKTIEINETTGSITQVFNRFGKVRKLVIDPQNFQTLEIKFVNIRFPKALLILNAKDKTKPKFELLRMDIADGNLNSREINARPSPLPTIAIVLQERFGLVNVSR